MGDTIKTFILNKLDELKEVRESDQIVDIVTMVKETFNTQCKHFYAGAFDSPGYDMECYVIAFIDEQGELQGIDVMIERY